MVIRETRLSALRIDTPVNASKQIMQDFCSLRVVLDCRAGGWRPCFNREGCHSLKRILSDPPLLSH